MSKRSAEQALRDELAEAEKALQAATERSEGRRLMVVEALASKKTADDRTLEATNRVARAKRALEALVPSFSFTGEPETTPNVVEPTSDEAGQVEEVAEAVSGKGGGRRAS